MTKAALIKINFEEIRRRSIMAWTGLTPDYYHWKPDDSAMSAIELIRHVLGADFGWNIIVSQGDVFSSPSPFISRPYTNLQDELDFAVPYRKTFLETVSSFTDDEIENTNIIHPGNGKTRKLGDYLLRIGYHEAVHAGQFLNYLRQMGLDRPMIWD